MARSHELQLRCQFRVQRRQPHIQRHWRQMGLGLSLCSPEKGCVNAYTHCV